MTMDEFFAKVEACTEKFEFEQELLQTKAEATPFCKTVKLLNVEYVEKNKSMILYSENGVVDQAYVNRDSTVFYPYEDKLICVSGAETIEYTNVEDGTEQGENTKYWTILCFYDISGLSEVEEEGFNLSNLTNEETKSYLKKWKKVDSAMQQDLLKKLARVSGVSDCDTKETPVVYRTMDEMELLYDVVKRVLQPEQRAEFENCRNVVNNVKSISSAEKNNLLRVMGNILDGVAERSLNEEIDVEKAMSMLREEYYGQDKVLETLQTEMIAANLSKKAPQTFNIVGKGGGTLAHLLANALNRPISVINLCGMKLTTTDQFNGSGRVYENGQEGTLYKYLKEAGPNGILVFEHIDEYDESVIKLVAPLLRKEPYKDSFMLVPMDLSANWIIATCKTSEGVPNTIRGSVKELVLEQLSDETKLQIINELMLPKLCREYHVNLFEKRCVSEEVGDVLIHQLGRNDMSRLYTTIRTLVIRVVRLGMEAFPALQTKQDLEGLISIENDVSLRERYVTELAEMENKFFQNYEEYPDKQRKKILELFEKVQNSRTEKEREYPLSVLRTLTNLLYVEADSYVPGTMIKEIGKTHCGLTAYAQALEDAILANQMRLQPDKITVICLHGEPGTGKTSTAQAVANALGRKLIQVNMPGKDATAFKGLPPSYSGGQMNCLAMEAAKESTSFGRCVFLLDEIDKMGSSSTQNAYDALHELFDPNQHYFHDEYADCNLQKDGAFFICTANDISKLPDSLLDRMHVIEMHSYSVAEKKEIARYISAKYAGQFGIESISFEEPALDFLIKHYDMHFGVRDLEKDIEKLVVRLLPVRQSPLLISVDDITKILGPTRSRGLIDVPAAEKEQSPLPGQANALAVAGSMGSCFAIQTMKNEFQKEAITVTGLLEGSCLESVKVAVNLASRLLKRKLPKLYIHCTDSGVKKNGPSAGITVLCSIVSCILNKPIPQTVAFTGTIDPLYHTCGIIGGVREKLTAAEQADMEKVYIPKANYEELFMKNELHHYSLEIIPVEDVAVLMKDLFDYDCEV